MTEVSEGATKVSEGSTESKEGITAFSKSTTEVSERVNNAAMIKTLNISKCKCIYNASIDTTEGSRLAQLCIKLYSMGLMSIIGKGIQAMIDEATTPQSFRIGEKFELYVREHLFIQKYYDLVEKTHSYTSNKDYVESSLKPDFKFRDRWTNKEFYVEAKFRANLCNNKIVWCTQQQLTRYLKYNLENPVFLILGVGNNPKYPEFLSLIHLRKARYTELFFSYANKFEIKPEEPISSKLLWSI